MDVSFELVLRSIITKILASLFTEIPISLFLNDLHIDAIELITDYIPICEHEVEIEVISIFRNP